MAKPPRPDEPDRAPAADSAHNGDIAALYRAHSDNLVAALRKMFGDGPPDPEDVAQQAFIKLMERPDRSDIKDLKAFLWQTARNTFLNSLAEKEARHRHETEFERLCRPSEADPATPAKTLLARRELEAVNEALRRMPDKRRDAFLLHRVEGLPVAAVARRLGIARAPARRHIARAIRDIELYLAGLEHKREK